MKNIENIRLIPVGEVKCLWMSYGLINYKLCDKNLDCDTCEFYGNIKNDNPKINEEKLSKPEFSNHDVGTQEENLFSFLNNYEIKDDYYYHRKHIWLNLHDIQKIEVGIDSFLSRLLPDNITVTLPLTGDHIDRGQPCCWITIFDSTFSFRSPISGRIDDVNKNLSTSSGLLKKSPYENGWLYHIRPSNINLESKKLLNPNQMKAVCTSDIKKLELKFNDVMKLNDSEIGLTMQDGGKPISSIFDVIGEAKYNQIISSIF